MKLKLFVTTIAVACVAMSQAAADKVIGYFPYWSQYSQFYPKDIRYNTVTHIHYSSLMPAEDGSLAFPDENDAPNYDSLAAMCAANNVQLVVSVGGMEAEGNLKAIASSEELLPKFVSNVKDWVSSHNAKGVELDWQNITAEDAADYAKMVNALVDALSGSIVASTMYPFVAMEPYAADVMNKLSYINVFIPDQMNEDNSTLVPNQGGKIIAETLDKAAGAGIQKDLLVPVVYFYGKSFLGATGFGSSHQGVGSGNEGYLPYKELMSKFDTPDYKVTFDSDSQSELAVSKEEAIVFMGIPSVKAVAENVKNNGFAGVAVYDVSQDHHEPIVSVLVTIGLELRPDVNYKTAKK